MSGLDMLADDFPHGTVDGYNRGCKGGHCPAPMSCRGVQMRFSGDYAFRKRIVAGLTVAEIIALELADATADAERLAAARLAARAVPANRARVPRQVRARTVREPREPRAARPPRPKTLRPSAEEREAARIAAALERQQARAIARAEKARMTAAEREVRAAEVAAARAVRAEEREAARIAAATANRKPVRHGTNAGYARGCITDEECPADNGITCKAANRQYHREYVAKRRAEGVPAEAHGTPYGYQLGCTKRELCPAELTCSDASIAEEVRRRRESH
jgi:hypothetical protein